MRRVRWRLDPLGSGPLIEPWAPTGLAFRCLASVSPSAGLQLPVGKLEHFTTTLIERHPQPSSRIAIIGAGHVGATTAYALMLRALSREIVLIDSNTALASAEAADLRDANALARPASIWAAHRRQSLAR